MPLNYLRRTLSGTLKRALQTFPAVVVTGPRQTGKTTLLREEFGNQFIEVKANQTPVPQMAESLSAWKRLLGSQAGETFLICDGGERLPLKDGVQAVPWRSLNQVLGEVFPAG